MKYYNNIMFKLFNDLNNSEIRYCHFKSNQHIRQSFAAASDFDLLVDKKDKARVNAFFVDYGVKRFESPIVNNYPDVENWLCFDDVTGNIYHIHLHYALITGTTHAKEYELGLEKILLDNSYVNSEYNVKMPEAEYELLLLMIRLALKGTPKDFVMAHSGKWVLSKSFYDEFIYLKNRSDIEKLGKICQEIFDADITAEVKKCFQSRIDSDLFLKLYNSFREYYSANRRFSFLNAERLFWTQECIQKFGKENKARGGFYITKKARYGRKGLSMAFVGVDGSGKTRVTQDIYSWLSKKIDSQLVYLGTGDNVTKDIRALKRLSRNYDKILWCDGGEEKTKIGDDIHDVLKGSIVLCVTERNKIILQRVKKYVEAGGICVMDRFPQLERNNENDGPKLGNLKGNNYIKNMMVEAEYKNLVKAISMQPDIIFRLNIDIDTCIRRKSEHTNKRTAFMNKLESLKRINYAGAKVVEIDATKPYAEELLEIKTIIWSLL
ncbi:hypothetical protein [Butyrivibrio sp. M55]|uniref:hypothetical protein n=1 Tax=Butyrivibrio sp. M55 TaxID=1855323 RepID=UPI0008EC86D5|nr:hypothetical protein [Butyrivibrio sp. M55]SFU66115.1 hypothetical protein SAMN05216540_105160 [Butyrivibrio sp. M55]